MKRIAVGPPRVTSKIRRSRVQSYGTIRDWYALAAEVRRRDGNRCVECGSTVDLEVHHIIPTSRGGPSVGYNLKTLCETCHKRKPHHQHLR